MYLSPPSIHCLGPIKLELLEPQANLQAALQVLELHYSKLDTTKVRGLPWQMEQEGEQGWGREQTGAFLGLIPGLPNLSHPLCPRRSTFCQQTLRSMTYASF